MIEIILLIVIILQFLFIFYQHWSFQQEREKLQLKLMSRDVNEYKEATEPTPKDMPKIEDPYKNLDDISIDKQLSAKDNI